MAAKKGTMPPNAGKGRKVGSVNKYTKAIKDMVEEALHGAGGVDYLVTQAHANPAAFMGLVGKLMPRKIDAEISIFTGEDLVDRLQEGRTLMAKYREVKEIEHDEQGLH